MEIKGKVVFASGRTADFDIWSLDLTTHTLSKLTGGEALHDTPRWSPDGKKIAYVSIGSDYISSLWLMDADGGSKEKLTSGMHVQYPSWSADGESIIFTANAEDPNEIEITQLKVADKSIETLVAREGYERDPSISPDGSKVVFSAVHPGDAGDSFKTDLIEYDFGTKQERVLVSHPAHDYSPVYSPDGTKIAFVSHREGMNEELYFSKVRELQILADSPSSGNEVKKAILELKSLEQDSDIYVMNADGSGLRQLTTNSGSDVGARWSPCGGFLLYTAADHGKDKTQRLHVLEVSSGESRELEYDRAPLTFEIGADPDKFLNKSMFQWLIPNILERKFADPSFWGEERSPDWAY